LETAKSLRVSARNQRLTSVRQDYVDSIRDITATCVTSRRRHDDIGVVGSCPVEWGLRQLWASS